MMENIKDLLAIGEFEIVSNCCSKRMYIDPHSIIPDTAELEVDIDSIEGICSSCLDIALVLSYEI